MVAGMDTEKSASTKLLPNECFLAVFGALHLNSWISLKRIKQFENV